MDRCRIQAKAAARGIDHLQPVTQHCNIVGPVRQNRLNGISVEHIVTVEEKNDVAGGSRKTDVDCGSLAAIRLMNDLNAILKPGQHHV
jgi:hypothetical protein